MPIQDILLVFWMVVARNALVFLTICLFLDGRTFESNAPVFDILLVLGW